MEEGRRRRQLYDERKWAAQSELRRVLAERAAVREKEGMLRLLLQVCFFYCFTLLCFVLGACSFFMRSCTYRDRESVDHAAAYLLGGWCGSVGHPLLVVRSARRSRATYKESTTLLLYVHD